MPEIRKGDKKMKKTLFMYFIVIITLFGALPIASATDAKKIKETLIGVSGTVTDPKANQFMLDYGKGKFTVEMDGWKWYTQNYSKMAGDKVTVYGILLETFLDGKTIDATSVYDEKMGKYFFGRSRDEAKNYKDSGSPIFDYWGKGKVIGVGYITVQGTVTSAKGRVFTIDTGKKKLTINTSSMPYDPLDKKGYQAIRKGDYLSVTGTMSEAFMDKGELVADHIVVLQKE